MVKNVTIDGKKTLAITNVVGSSSDVIELRKALFEVLENLLSSDEAKDNTSSLSLWYLTQLIQAIEPEKGE